MTQRTKTDHNSSPSFCSGELKRQSIKKLLKNYPACKELIPIIALGMQEFNPFRMASRSISGQNLSSHLPATFLAEFPHMSQIHMIWALMQENLCSGFLTRLCSNYTAHRQGSAKISKFACGKLANIISERE